MVSRFHIPLICFRPRLLFSYPLTAPSHAAHSSALWMKQKRNASLWWNPAQPGEPGAHSNVLTVPREELKVEKGFHRTELCHERGNTRKVKLFLLPSSVHGLFLLHSCARTFPPDFWTSQRLSHLWEMV